MKKHFFPEQIALLPVIGRWLLLATLVGVLSGLASALLLASLDWATATRLRHPWLLYLLPVAGLAIGWIYHRHGQSVEAGKIHSITLTFNHNKELRRCSLSRMALRQFWLQPSLNRLL